MWTILLVYIVGPKCFSVYRLWWNTRQCNKIQSQLILLLLRKKKKISFMLYKAFIFICCPTDWWLLEIAAKNCITGRKWKIMDLRCIHITQLLSNSSVLFWIHQGESNILIVKIIKHLCGKLQKQERVYCTVCESKSESELNKQHIIAERSVL